MNAFELAEFTEKCNNTRKMLMARDFRLVKKLLKKHDYSKDTVVVIANADLHPQVVGIVASQTIGIVHKPVIIAGHLNGDPKDVFRGSGRSIPQFDLFKAMNPLRKDMKSFGGHSMACGLTIKVNMINKLRKDLNTNAQKLGDTTPTIKPDILANSSEINLKLVQKLNQLAPFGNGNHQPVFALKAHKIYNIKTMSYGKHLKFALGNNNSSVRVVAFNQGKLFKSLVKNPYHVELVGTLGMHYYRGTTSIQFNTLYICRYNYVLDRNRLVFLYRSLCGLATDNKLVSSQKLFTKVPLDKRVISLGLKVFKQLHFIKQNKRSYKVTINPIAQPLSNSKIYRKYA